VSPEKTAEPVEVPFWGLTCVNFSVFSATLCVQ